MISASISHIYIRATKIHPFPLLVYFPALCAIRKIAHKKDEFRNLNEEFGTNNTGNLMGKISGEKKPFLRVH